MDELSLDPEITLSAMRGEDPADYVETLEHVYAVAQQRFAWLAQHGPAAPAWGATVITIIPSSEVLRSDQILRRVEVLARIGRKADVAIRLLDVIPPLREADQDGPVVYSIACFGSTTLRVLASDPSIGTVSYHQISAAEMVMLTESV